MMFYVEITLLPNLEVPLHFIWEKVYQQLHLALVENKVSEYESAIGISFPKYGDKPFPLGDKLRLFAPTQEQLQQLDVGRWLNRLTDYIDNSDYTSIKKVPSNVNEFACFKQFRIKSNFMKKVERRAKHLNKPIDEVRKYMRKEDEDRGKRYTTGLPFVYAVSLSQNKEKFRLFIEKQIVKQAQAGTFNCYGLSSRDPGKQATVPWFE